MINDSDEKTEETEVKVEEKTVKEEVEEKIEEKPVEKIAEQEPTSEETLSSSVEDTKITQDNANAEIGKMKQQLSQGINNLQAEMGSENINMPQYIPTYVQADPIDQIRRYHELKEDGIITEEEFELKKKQLLDL